jgi:hypothetical protein
MPELSILEYLLSAGHPDDCPPPPELTEPNPSYTAPCLACGSYEPCPHDLMEFDEEEGCYV